jgi:hypothetical protein
VPVFRAGAGGGPPAVGWNLGHGRVLKEHLKIIGAIVAAALLAWAGYERIEANRHLVLFEVALAFLLSAYFVAALRGRWRDVSLVCASLLLGVLAVEVVLWRMNNSPTTFREKGSWGIKGELGLSPVRPGVIHERKVAANGDVIFDVTYTINDDLTRKVVSGDGPLVAFFGDSFTYGAGVNDGETLPQAFADLTKGAYRVLNFGVSGYGPQQTVRALETGLYTQLNENPRLFVIQTAPWHMFRTSCKADNAWFGPAYVLEDGQPVYKGSCASQKSLGMRALTTLLRWTEAYDHFIGHREKPADVADADLYIALLVKAGEIARQKYGVPMVVLYLPDDLANPRYQLGPAFSNESIVRRLREGGLKVMDLTIDLNAYSVQQLIIPGDGHPTGLLNRIWANRLVDYIGTEVDAGRAVAAPK